LPSFEKNVIKLEYLWGVFTGANFWIKQLEIKVGTLMKKVTKVDLFQEICSVCSNFGFTISKLPEKVWMTNILFTLKPNHFFFSPPHKNPEIPMRNVPLEYIFFYFFSLIFIIIT